MHCLLFLQGLFSLYDIVLGLEHVGEDAVDLFSLLLD